MHSAFYTTTRLFLKRAWGGALLAVSVLVLSPLLYRIVYDSQSSGPVLVNEQLFGVHIMYLVLSSIFFLAVCYYSIQGTQKICMGLPMRSRPIATWMMLATVCLAVLLQLVTNGAYRLLFFDSQWLSDYWPLFGPLLFLVTLILVSHAIYWGLYAISFTRALCWAGTVVGLFWWFVVRYYPDGFQESAVSWKHVTLTEFLTLLTVSLGAWYLGTREFANVRSGVAVPSPYWQKMQGWWESVMTGTASASSQRPVSISASLSRLHWRDACQRTVLGCGMVCGAAVWVVNLILMREFGSTLHQWTDGFLAIVGVFGILAAMLSAFQIGEGVCISGRAEMKSFLATAPLSDRDFGRALFRNLVKSVLAIFLMIQLGLAMTLLTVLLLKGPTLLNWELVRVSGLLLKYGCIYLFAFWIIAANVISLFWTGRTWFIFGVMGVILAGFAFIVGVGSYLQDAYPHRIGSAGYSPFEIFLVTTALSLSFFILGGTSWAYIAACSKQLIRVSTAVAALVVWVIGAVLAFGFVFRAPHPSYYYEDLAGSFLVFAVCSLSLAPIPTIPLALGWNRHR
ncbi:hypothetical protein [Gimesia panareensis]|uniref:hypothetical protein n=1 Tax=Gimesia panareensis TaxID=2527978 RepID=UPI00118D26E1|nr:hypothetical protein [Gimesia panareensis]QDU53410.1 hypothetical protein Pan110_58010 [Gimesia panareensis]